MGITVWNMLSPQIVEKNAQSTYNLTVPAINYGKVYFDFFLFNLTNNAITDMWFGIVTDTE